MGGEVDIDVAWLTPQSEYRPTQYLQQWVRFWFDEPSRLFAAKQFQQARIALISKSWLHPSSARQGFEVDADRLLAITQASIGRVEHAPDNEGLLLEEARMTRALFKLAADTVSYGDFVRGKRGSGADAANRFLDHGNYLAYGLGATACWVLGIPHGLAVLHGKTRRGGLVFDVADLVKDAIVLPQAFLSAMRGDDEQQFRHACISALMERNSALDFMIDTLKDVSAVAARRIEQ